MESCRVFRWKGRPRFSAFGMERLRSWVAQKFSGSFLPRYAVFHPSRVAELHFSGGRPVFPQVPQCRFEAVLAASKLTQATQRPLDVARGVMLSTWFRQSDRSPAEANIISTATGKRRAFAFDRREMRRRANAAYDLPAAGCRTRVPAPNTCKLARLSRAIQRGFGR